MSEYMLEARGIVKLFPGVRALDGVDLKIKQGEVHALVGENGAGKSTLMLALGGIHTIDAGEIYIDGQKVKFSSALDAQNKGIGIVFQELSVVPGLSVAENIFANRQPVGAANLIRQRELYRMTTEMLALFGMQDIDPRTLVKDLPLGRQQVVEILKAMSLNPKVLILDEPTSSLTGPEVVELFRNIRLLKEKGITFIYISHHLHEIFEIADRVTVLRDGQFICDADVQDIDEDFLVTKMVGRKLENIYGRRPTDCTPGDVLFRAENIGRRGVFHNISFEVRAGEIVGMSGLVGAKRTEIGRAIFGAEPLDSGTITLEGKPLKIHSCRQAIDAGIGYMSEDRKLQGLYLNFSIKANVISNRLDSFTKHGFLREENIDGIVRDAVQEFGIATPNIEQLVGNLSGGNQQKVMLATWFGINPKFLIVDEPTRGVDVGAKSEIYALLRRLAAQGVGILMISSDLPEVLGVSDRILVVKEGAIVAQIDAAQATEEQVIAAAAGVVRSNEGGV